MCQLLRWVHLCPGARWGWDVGCYNTAELVQFLKTGVERRACSICGCGRHLLERLARGVLLPLVQRSASDAANGQQHRCQRALQGVWRVGVDEGDDVFLRVEGAALLLAFKMAKPIPPRTPIRQYL
jgi:hypothetical protein